MKKQKTKIATIGIIFSIALLICSCSTINQGSSIAAKTPTEPKISSISPVAPTNYNVVSLLTHQEALKQMYGKNLNISPNNKASITSADGVKYSIQINVFSCYWDASNLETCFVITDRSRCMGCSSYIDGATFDRTYRDWHLHSFRSDILEMGASKGELIQIGNARYAVKLKWTYTSTGSSVEHLVIITEALDVVLDIISRGEKISNDGNGLEWGWNTTLNFQETDETRNYYNLFVTYYGEKGKPYSKFYTFSDGRYVLVATKND